MLAFHARQLKEGYPRGGKLTGGQKYQSQRFTPKTSVGEYAAIISRFTCDNTTFRCHQAVCRDCDAQQKRTGSANTLSVFNPAFVGTQLRCSQGGKTQIVLPAGTGGALNGTVRTLAAGFETNVSEV